MAPPSSSAAERHYHANGKAALAPPRAEKQPGTPRRDKGQGRESLALQDPGLKDYRLGECIGKGAFGSVYKAFNWGNGEAVAVKQIKLGDLPKSELRMIESEIDLLKNLHHDNIVKYIGFVKSADCLNIILEYCENGSLHSILKAYGKFPENLVGVYMTQVLQGLQYLHDQGVIHRDIKGANILTTKDGTVKLADFGVSTSTLTGPDKEAQVVGTPYWMAPEIIQLSGASSASDIWSVGCTVIELLQGKPPYHNLAAMPALFAIVNDDHPPLPEGISPAARDFLMQCFQKDPNLRVTARKLLRHAWIFGCQRSEPRVSKAPANFTQAVEEVKQWNKALKSSEAPLRNSTGSESGGPFQPGQNMSRFRESDAHRSNHATPAKGPLNLAKPRALPEVFGSPELADDDNWDDDFATSISPSALHLPHLKPQDNFGGLLSADRLKAFASSSDLHNGSESYDEDFEGELLTIKVPRGALDDIDAQEKTLRPLNRKVEQPREPSKSHSGRAPRTFTRSSTAPISSGPTSLDRSHASSRLEMPPRPDLTFQESIEEYSDLQADDDSIFRKDLNLPLRRGPRQSDAPQLFHPSDLTSLPRSMQSPTAAGSVRRQVPSRPSVLPDRPMRRTQSSVEIQRFTEDEGDEDFSDILGPDEALTEKAESEKGSEDGGLMLLSKLSNSSWLGDDEDEDDPFATMDPGWDEMDLEANIARDRHARLCERVEELVRSLKTTESEDILSDLSEDLLALLWESSEVKDLIISAHGLLPILEILEPCTVKSRQHMILQLLKIVNTIILDDVEIQENLCFVGGIPIITKFAARQYSNEIRLEAAAFVRQMYQTSTLTLQMFVSAGGLNVLVEFLFEDYDSARDLVLISVNGIWNVFELQGPTPKNDFCRIFSRSKILYPLALVLHRVLDEEDEKELSELIEGRIVNIFYLFSQAENYVKEVVADRQVLKSVLKDLRRMTPIHQVTMLKFIKNLSMLSTTLEVLHSADAIEFLIDLLSYSMKRGQIHFREISNQVLNTMFNLCRLSKARQEDAAVNGIIPLLLRIMRTDRPPKEFVLPIICDMAHSGRTGRRYLWQNKGLDFYVSLLADQYWQVTALDAVLVWLQEETANVEGHLLQSDFTKTILSCFSTNKLNSFDSNLLEPLLKLLRLSPSIAASFAVPEMFTGIGLRLGHKKAVVRLNLLRLVRIILDACDPDMMGLGNGSSVLGSREVQSLLDTIRVLAEKDSAVLVRNLASELVKLRVERAAFPDLPVTAPGTSRRSGSGGRRTYTPPGLHVSMSMPPTPTPGGGPRYRNAQALSGGGGAYIEVAASPRRTTASHPLDRDAIVYRPRSRDGTGIPRRVSGDASAGVSPNGTPGGGSGGGGRSRLPRTSLSYSRSSFSGQAPPVISRSESALSNKENVGRGITGSPAVSVAGKRRTRAPSDAKWGSG
ncbi:related to septation (sepH) gene [Cephalotrichum gorgonifer]|uniref:non-specific serine/threonine protein kinase n=1 Tax=Cephalotrichum gorgonifer TaxID=2041049 RepID=A0AAE8SRG9_9PEZI|nr:related to septation (sepH) gene [Cephalotrichum gorgonifer]